MNLKRTLRGIVGTMGTWAAVFAIVGIVGLLPLSVLGALPSMDFNSSLRFAIASAAQWALGGAAIGAVFAAAVLVAERRHTLASVSSRRFALWGFVGGVSVSMGFTAIYALMGRSSASVNLQSGLLFAGICGSVGAGLAALSLRTARRSALSSGQATPVHAPVI